MNQRPIRLGIAGLGRAFSLMLPTFLQESRVKLVAACDPRENARSQFARDFGSPVYHSMVELAADPSVEAVYVASPHQFHAEHTRIAAKYGKHVLVEKPMALTMAECDAMIAACRDAGVYLIVGHSHSFDWPYRQARDYIETGEVGRVKMILAMNYTDFLYRPRRPEELITSAGGGVVFSQAAHQVDIVRMLAGSRAIRVRATTGSWDPARPTEGAYCALIWFDDGVCASLVYSGYGHFDSDEWCDWVGEMGLPKNEHAYGNARARLNSVKSADEEARLKAAGTYGSPSYTAPNPDTSQAIQKMHQHFGPVIVTCERGDVRPTPGAVWTYGDARRERRELTPPDVPRFEVIDELYAAVVSGKSPFHDGPWAKSTLEICLALLQSAREQRDITLEGESSQ